jgi:hypothetical protein
MIPPELESRIVDVNSVRAQNPGLVNKKMPIVATPCMGGSVAQGRGVER